MIIFTGSRPPFIHLNAKPGHVNAFWYFRYNFSKENDYFPCNFERLFEKLLNNDTIQRRAYLRTL